ncbi:hypothetical protein BpHYR1_005741 [Brachionus plicatilis]|uniref:Uncharacterized protein n=1 Tax=Brachionus plicatilis TaxID=10195 RepID=A0A3M7S1Q0_BRAPC|nr:hypothetical protein BpHYR1_005741 [Brachionus plicatilis]
MKLNYVPYALFHSILIIYANSLTWHELSAVEGFLAKKIRKKRNLKKEKKEFQANFLSEKGSTKQINTTLRYSHQFKSLEFKPTTYQCHVKKPQLKNHGSLGRYGGGASSLSIIN